jgi:hypothetical protein
MAKFSMKKGGKEVGSAAVYAEPHTMTGGSISLGNGYSAEPTKARQVDMSVGNINRDGYDPAVKTSGIEIRGCGAATKGTKARGPMA